MRDEYMNENLIQNMETDDVNGRLIVSEETVAQIASIAALKVEGVIRISPSATDEFRSMMGEDSVRGIRAEVGEKEAIIDVAICIAFDESIENVARQVKKTILKEVEEMTQLHVIEVNVNIIDIAEKSANVDEQTDINAIEKDVDETDAADTDMILDAETEEVKGTVTISEYVPASIAGRLVRKIPGVAGMSSGFAGEIAGMLSEKSYAKGVKVEMGLKEMILSMYIDISFGYRIPDVSWTVQERVKKEVEKYTGFTVKEVNISIQGISFDDEQAIDVEEGEQK